MKLRFETHKNFWIVIPTIVIDREPYDESICCSFLCFTLVLQL
jgi:hypothetical protein